MVIAAIDTDRQYLRILGKTLKHLLNGVKFKAFTSAADCLKFAADHPLDLIFINQNIGRNFADLQMLHHQLRILRPHVDMIIVYGENEEDSHVALWSIQSRCSDYICKTDSKDRLNDALRNIWFHPIEASCYSVYAQVMSAAK